MNEPAPGLRANVLELLQTIPSHLLDHGPSEKTRVFFLLCWLQAVVIQRLRYAPLATTKVYDFNDSDFRAALQRLSAWVDEEARGRSNIDPESIPWPALRLILSQYAIGGRIDVEQDQAVLDSLISHLFSPRAYDSQFQLSPGASLTALPDGTSIQTFRDFASALPELEQPSILGLPPSAATVVAANEGMFAKIIHNSGLTKNPYNQAKDSWILCERCRV